MLTIKVDAKKRKISCSVDGDNTNLTECAAAMDALISYIRKNDNLIQDEQLRSMFEVCLTKEEEKGKWQMKSQKQKQKAN